MNIWAKFLIIPTVFIAQIQPTLARECTIVGLTKVDEALFFVGGVGCKSTNCLKKITNRSTSDLKVGSENKLIYVPPQDSVEYESAALFLSDRRRESSKNPKKIDLSRSQITFECNVQGDNDSKTNFGVSYKTYEKWHLTGNPRRTPFGKWLLNEFHFKYNANGECIGTATTGVRERFKFSNRDSMATAFDRLASEFAPQNGIVGKAMADKPSARKVHVEAYSGKASQSEKFSCISYEFDAPEANKKITISLDDLVKHIPKKEFLFSTTLKHFIFKGVED